MRIKHDARDVLTLGKKPTCGVGDGGNEEMADISSAKVGVPGRLGGEPQWKRRLLAVVVVVVVIRGSEHRVRQALAAAHGSRAVRQAAQRAADQADRLVTHGAQPRTQRCRRNHAAAVCRHDGGPSEGQGATPGAPRSPRRRPWLGDVVDLFARNASSVSCHGNGSCGVLELCRYGTEALSQRSTGTLTGTLIHGEASFFC
ncbi:hypothetical protein MRX96_012495 [Rhipicephalus microplus]